MSNDDNLPRPVKKQIDPPQPNTITSDDTRGHSKGYESESTVMNQAERTEDLRRANSNLKRSHGRPGGSVKHRIQQNRSVKTAKSGYVAAKGIRERLKRVNNAMGSRFKVKPFESNFKDDGLDRKFSCMSEKYSFDKFKSNPFKNWNKGLAGSFNGFGGKTKSNKKNYSSKGKYSKRAHYRKHR